MYARRSTNWFLTDQGRRFSFALVTGTGLALTAARFVPHTFFLEKYKDFVHSYNNGRPVDLPKELQDRYQECLKLLKVTAAHKKLIQPFSVFGFDLFHAGSTSFRFGALIGIPCNYAYKTFDDIEKHDAQVNQKKVDLTSETGHKLGEALLLSDKEQEFGICREILMTQNNKVMFESAYPFACLFLIYNLSQYLNRRHNLYAAHVSIRASLYSILGLFGLGTYFLLKDMTEVHYEISVDNKLSELGPDYIESGVTFYQKMLNRNQALRELMGKEGVSKYSKLGNVNYGIRQPHIALVHRKNYFEEKLKAYKTNSEEKSIDSSLIS